MPHLNVLVLLRLQPQQLLHTIIHAMLLNASLEVCMHTYWNVFLFTEFMAVCTHLWKCIPMYAGMYLFMEMYTYVCRYVPIYRGMYLFLSQRSANLTHHKCVLTLILNISLVACTWQVFVACTWHFVACTWQAFLACTWQECSYVHTMCVLCIRVYSIIHTCKVVDGCLYGSTAGLSNTPHVIVRYASCTRMRMYVYTHVCMYERLRRDLRMGACVCIYTYLVSHAHACMWWRCTLMYTHACDGCDKTFDLTWNHHIAVYRTSSMRYCA